MDKLLENLNLDRESTKKGKGLHLEGKKLFPSLPFSCLNVCLCSTTVVGFQLFKYLEKNISDENVLRVLKRHHWKTKLRLFRGETGLIKTWLETKLKQTICVRSSSSRSNLFLTTY